MKFLILSANTGQGHNSCAKAISDVCTSHGDICVTEDVFALVSPMLSRAISKNHDRTYRRNPGLSEKSYRYMETHPEIFSQKRFIFHLMSTGRKQVAACIRQTGCEAVICTHVLAAMILTAALQKEGLTVPSAFVATDYSCCPGINGTALDRYFIPHHSLIHEFLAADVPPEKIIPTGIPVNSAFAATQDKRLCKETFNISCHHRHLLIMCGSMGCGPIPELLRRIAACLPEDWEITVVCGTNTSLKNQLEKEYSSLNSIHIRGYETRMPELLFSADLFLTKPGGLSTTEAAAACIPMVFVDAVSGCEENNLRYFVKNGMAIAGTTPKDVADQCLQLMKVPARIDQMTTAMGRITSSNAAESIYCDMVLLAKNTHSA